MESVDPGHERSVVIIGGGLAGIAAATGLAQHGIRPILLEARAQLGGRATSYVDRQSGETIDNCQHVSMGCCTNLEHLCRTLGTEAHFREERTLYFVGPEGSVTPFTEGFWPAPFHLSGAFLKLPYLSLGEKQRFAWAVRALARASAESLSGQNFEQWLRAHRQTESLIRKVWEVVLVSALSESVDRIDAVYARKVFVDGFLTNRRGWRVRIPNVSLQELYSAKTRTALEELRVRIGTSTRVTGIGADATHLEVKLQSGAELMAGHVILAVPQHQVARLVPASIREHSIIRGIERIETAPITSLHLWFDRPITDLPHAVLLGRTSQWLFPRPDIGGSPADGYGYQIVISASRNLNSLEGSETASNHKSVDDTASAANPHEHGLVELVRKELAGLFPDAQEATLLRHRVITERRAVFSATPGIDDLRPSQQSPIVRLQFAGDWTQTGWPATMEGAVRSGYLAAENILRRFGHAIALIQPELPISRLARWLLGIRPHN